MAQYKVPQDVEADDKLLGPFSFRQFVYLLIAAGLIALAVGLFQIFPLLAIIPIPPILLFAALALPLRKDQPMETYLAAIVSFYLKPRKRVWTPGQRESTIEITAPKIVDDSRARDITSEEATHRLSFLADIVDTKGYAIKGAGSNSMREDLIAEANATNDIFENHRFNSLENAIEKDENKRHEEIMAEMRQAIKANEEMMGGQEAPSIQKFSGQQVQANNDALINQETVQDSSPLTNSVMVQNDNSSVGSGMVQNDGLASKYSSSVVVLPSSEPIKQDDEKQIKDQIAQKSSIIELANNPDFSISTIAKEAKRIKERKENEVFISLH